MHIVYTENTNLKYMKNDTYYYIANELVYVMYCLVLYKGDEKLLNLKAHPLHPHRKSSSASTRSGSYLADTCPGRR